MKEKFRKVAEEHNDCVRRGKAQLELEVERNNKASFCHCLSSAERNKENVDLLLNKTGDSVMTDTDKKSSEPSFPQFSPGTLRGLGR